MSTIEFKWNNNDAVAYGSPNVEQFEVDVAGTTFTPGQLFSNVDVPEVPAGGLGYLGTIKVTCTGYIGALGVADWDATGSTEVDNTNTTQGYVGQPQLTEFPLTNIDDMRMDILEAVRQATDDERSWIKSSVNVQRSRTRWNNWKSRRR